MADNVLAFPRRSALIPDLFEEVMEGGVVPFVLTTEGDRFTFLAFEFSDPVPQATALAAAAAMAVRFNTEQAFRDEVVMTAAALGHAYAATVGCVRSSPVPA